MAESTNSQPSIVDKLKSKLSDLKDRLKEGNLTSSVFNDLSGSAKEIQDKLNEILAKNGVLTSADIEDAYKLLQDKERGFYEKKMKSNTTKLYVVLGLLIVGGGLYWYKKNKKS
jgi:LPXTG-motif cell wall-anchored protein